MQKSVDLPRFHHLWLPDKIFYEENILSENIKSNLSKKKYLFNETSSVIGRVDAIHVDKNDYLYPGADKRGDDTAIGY
jgi:gamma-glutamyltranspeptidase/glutathione hydrolase